MEITGLPNEIMFMIINMLDTKSVKALYQSCSHFANIVGMSVKECHFSLNTLANAKSLTSNFFCNIANHLRVLNLCAVQDLTKTLLLPAMKKLKNLYSLDVTFTAITVKDLLLIHKVCPTMKSIAINLAFTKPGQDPINLPARAIIEYQNMFKNFESVHFVYDNNAWCSRIIFILLVKAHLKSLTGTYTHISFTNSIQNWKAPLQDDAKITNNICKSLNLSFSNAHLVGLEPLLYGNVSFENTEYLIFSYSATKHEFKCRVVCTPLLRPFFHENFGINAGDDVDSMFITPDNLIVVMFWKQDTTVFDDVFFRSLFKRLQPIVPLNFMPVTQHSYYRNLIKNWVFLKSHTINSTTPQKSIDEPMPSVLKRRRIAPHSVVLDCDAHCSGMKDIVLMVSFATLSNAVTLSSSSVYLKELTHLYLMNRVIYDSDFFNVLIRTCDKLETLDVDLCKSNSSALFSKSIPLSKSVKNLRLSDDNINFATLFYYLSQCRSLENIHIDDTTNSYDPMATKLANPRAIFVNCTNLYNFTVNVCWPETCIKNNLKLLKKIKADLRMHHLHVNAGSRRKPFLHSFSCFGFDKHYQILSPLCGLR